jgi:iron(III) transport system permease protein
LLRPQLLAAGAIVWILTLNDYAIPSIFSVNTYAIEIFVEYSSSYNLARTILKSLPLVLLQTAVLTIILSLVPQVFLSGRLQDFSGLKVRFPPFLDDDWCVLGPLLAVLAAAVPLSVIVLSQEMWLDLGLTFGQSVTDYLTSLGISALAIAIGSPLALWTARWIHASGVSRMGLFLILGPVAIPGTLTGVALIHLFQPTLEQLDLQQPAAAGPGHSGPFFAVCRPGDSGLAPAARPRADLGCHSCSNPMMPGQRARS